MAVERGGGERKKERKQEKESNEKVAVKISSVALENNQRAV